MIELPEPDFEYHPSGYTAATVRRLIAEAVAADRHRCRVAIMTTKDRSGINDDGQTWLQRATRADFIAAINALPLPGEAK